MTPKLFDLLYIQSSLRTNLIIGWCRWRLWQLVLQVLNLLSTHLNQPKCFIGISQMIQFIHCQHCSIDSLFYTDHQSLLFFIFLIAFINFFWFEFIQASLNFYLKVAVLRSNRAPLHFLNILQLWLKLYKKKI